MSTQTTAKSITDEPDPEDGTTESVNPWRVAVTTGWKAAKENRFAAVALWLFGVLLITGYFYVPSVHDVLESIGRIKTSYGWKFSVVSTGIFGGLIPALLPWLMRQPGIRASLGLVISNTLLWAYKGLEIDLFYHFQAWLFGTTLNFHTIAIKTFCDQFVMVPLFGIVNVVLFYLWRDCGYSFKTFLSRLGKKWYRRRILPVLIANWVIWIPAVAMIYSLPVALQLPVQNLILCFWVLILVFFTSHEKPISGD